MSTDSSEVAKNMWAISVKVQKQKLMRRFLETHGELTPKNDFVGFLISELGLDTHNLDVGPAGG